MYNKPLTRGHPLYNGRFLLVSMVSASERFHYNVNSLARELDNSSEHRVPRARRDHPPSQVLHASSVSNHYCYCCSVSNYSQLLYNQRQAVRFGARLLLSLATVLMQSDDVKRIDHTTARLCGRPISSQRESSLSCDAARWR